MLGMIPKDSSPGVEPVVFSSKTHVVLDDDECTFRINNQSHSHKHSSSSTNKRTSGLRFKFMLEGTRRELMNLKRRNEQLRAIVREYVRPLDVAEEILRNAEAPMNDIFLPSSVLLDDEMELRNICSSTTTSTSLEGLIVNQQTDNTSVQPDMFEIPEQIDIKTTTTITTTTTNTRQVDSLQKSKRMNEIKVDSSVYESGQLESLAAALNGEIAF